MPKTSLPAAEAVAALSSADIERAAEFAREPILLEGETLDDARARAPPGGSPSTRALAELDAGAEDPSMEWRRDFSLLLGLERVLAEDVPTLNDGAELNEHQVDALSGTLAALVAEVENPGSNATGNNGINGTNGGTKNANSEPNGNGREEDDELLGEDEEPQDWERLDRRRRGVDRARRPTTPAPAAASGSSTRPAPARPSPPSASSRPRGPAAS